MTARRRTILIGMAAGALWALAVVFAPSLLGLPYLPRRGGAFRGPFCHPGWCWRQ